MVVINGLLAGPVYVVNTSTLLSAEDNYVLDDHYRASGHEKIAAAITRIIQSASPQNPF